MVVVGGAASGQGPVLVPGAALAGHGPVQSAVQVAGAVGPGVTGGHSLGHEVRLLPARLPVHVPQLLVLPHAEEDLTGELHHPAESETVKK